MSTHNPLILSSLVISAACSTGAPELDRPPIETDQTGRVLPASMTAGEKIGKADAHDPRDDYPQYYGYTNPPPGDVVLPGEFEPTDQLLIGWGSGAWQVGNFFADIILSADSEVPITIYTPTQEDALDLSDALADIGANMANIDFSVGPLGTIWMRDYGPMMVRSQFGMNAIDGRYYWGRWGDDYMPTAIGNAQSTPVYRPPLDMEGGNLLGDGTGRCVVTTWMIEQNSFRGYTATDLREVLEDYYGCTTTAIVPPMQGEGTGHVDMSVHITGPGKALVGDYSPSVDFVNSERLDTVAQRMQNAGFDVTRIPMPDNDGQWVFRSYTNALAVNDVVLVPVYDNDQQHEAAALSIFQAAYPGKQVVPIVSDDIIEWSGAVHCVTMTSSP